jgi:hypothetical protein
MTLTQANPIDTLTMQEESQVTQTSPEEQIVEDFNVDRKGS